MAKPKKRGFFYHFFLAFEAKNGHFYTNFYKKWKKIPTFLGPKKVKKKSNFGKF